MECDVLICGGGMAGCGAAYEAAYWAKSKGLRVVLVEKAAIERSGAVAMGLSPIHADKIKKKMDRINRIYRIESKNRTCRLSEFSIGLVQS